MTKDANQKFLNDLEKLASALYRKGDSISHGSTWERGQSFIAGFCKAGVNLGVATSEEIQQTIDRAHVSVYGQGRDARREQFQPIQDGSGDPDWGEFDSPTYERSAPRTSK